MKKAVIFDLDGTLYDKSGLAMRLVWSQLHRGALSLLKREREVRKELRGKHFASEDAFYKAFFSRFDKPEFARRWYFDQYMPDMVSILRKHYRIATWVESQMLELRARGLKVVVFSDYGSVQQKLEAIGFRLAWADYLFEAPALGGLKPCKESFEKICQTMDVLPKECLMVGDRQDTDGNGARSAGMAFVYVVKAGQPNLNPYFEK
jgi:HAD superfamily hydrolase (TIGR01549 family)